jgi:hypothetical protein
LLKILGPEVECGHGSGGEIGRVVEEVWKAAEENMRRREWQSYLENKGKVKRSDRGEIQVLNQV